MPGTSCSSPPYVLDAAAVPDSADLVVVGNPTNPTSVLHPADRIPAVRGPGRIVVVDEAFADAVPGEVESLAGRSLPDVLVLRSLTKTWALAGLRCGYALGSPEILETPAGAAGALAAGNPAAGGDRRMQRTGRRRRRRSTSVVLAAWRDEMVAGLPRSASTVHQAVRTVPAAPPARRRAGAEAIDAKGIAVRRCDTFLGLGPALPPRDGASRLAGVLIDAMKEILRVSAQLADVIDVLDAAYPPALAQDWDSVGLVCGDPDDDVESVTIAVDATAAVVDEVPRRGLLLAHHPLLLRGVDTVARRRQRARCCTA